MRQIADLAVWVGMIGLAVGVIHFAPVVVEYVSAESEPRSAAAPALARARTEAARPPFLAEHRRSIR